jgi:hypothetical protein
MITRRKLTATSRIGTVACTLIGLVTLALFFGCATWTGTVEGVATESDLEMVPLTQTLASSGFELRMPDGWIAREVTDKQRQEESMLGIFLHPDRRAALAVFAPRSSFTVKAVRAEVDHNAEIMLPGKQLSDGPFSFGRTALAPMYIQYSGSTVRDGIYVDRQVYGGWNLSRNFAHHIMIMIFDSSDAEWGKRQFVSIMDEF